MPRSVNNMTEQQKVFVVTMTNFEYDDEIHSVGESEGGTPVAVFLTSEEAREELKKRTVDFLKDWKTLCGFGYGVDEIYSRRPRFLKLQGIKIEDHHQDKAFFHLNSHEVDDMIDIPNRSQEDLEELAICLSFMPCFITEVPLGSSV